MYVFFQNIQRPLVAKLYVGSEKVRRRENDTHFRCHCGECGWAWTSRNTESGAKKLIFFVYVRLSVTFLNSRHWIKKPFWYRWMGGVIVVQMLSILPLRR